MMDWIDTEVELIIADYFSMLIDELRGKAINKAQHRKALMPLLSNRTNGAVEFKHQNISAVLIGMGIPFIKGYKPRFNFQKLLLTKKVQQYLLQHPFLDSIFIDFADKSVFTLQNIDFNKWVYPAPVIQDEDFNNFSLEQEKNYHLYRIFDFNHHPKIFTCVGNYNQFCKISPTHYSGAFV